MIRLFTILYKVDFKRVPSAIELFHEIDRRFSIYKYRCPKCGSRGHLDWHDTYNRGLTYYDNGAQDERVIMKRVKCEVCNSSHATIPDVLVPYSTYCILFILMTLKDYALRALSVAGICQKYGIAVSTLYSWKARYLKHKALELGPLVEKALLLKDKYLSKAEDICRDGCLNEFFARFGFSFMQYSRTAEYNST